MKILILSNSEWDDGNSFGSSFSNIFGNISNLEIANIYCRSGMPNTKSCSRFFQITEKLLLKNLMNSSNPGGQFVIQSVSKSPNPDIFNYKPDIFNYKQEPWINFIKKKRWILLFWLRDFIWWIGRWESNELKQFIDEFEPDLIFLPIYYSVYLNKIGLFLKKYANKPMVGYISDDNYTLRQFSLNPLFWIDRFIKRKWIKQAVNECEILYVISELQKKDYDKSFNKNCKILFKGGNFHQTASLKEKINDPIKFVYTGNIGTGRYKILSKIGEALNKINHKEIKANLHIYSQTPLSSSMQRAILFNKSIKFYGGIHSSQISGIQKDADVLVHVESFQLKERLLVRQSFSTKIVDYFQAARCVFAVGWNKTASISYLAKNQIAIVASNRNQIEHEICSLIDSPLSIIEFGQKAWDFGKRNHQIDIIQAGLLNDLQQLVDSSKHIQ